MPITTEQQGELAWNIHNQIAENEIQRRNLLLENAELINKIYSKKLYRVILGDEEAPWSAYLGLKETFYSASKIYTLNRVWKTFVRELECEIEQLKNLPLTKLNTLLSVVNKSNVSEWLVKAGELTNQDFADEIRKATGKISYLECEHTDEIEYKICQKCGYRHKV